jgi:TBC1 domain family member 14
MLLKEEKRKQELQRRREAHEKEVEESIPRWQQEVLPDWRRVLREPSLRQLWWRGIPPKLRGQLWEKAVGNPLQIGKGLCHAKLIYGKSTLNINFEF